MKAMTHKKVLQSTIYSCKISSITMQNESQNNMFIITWPNNLLWETKNSQVFVN